MTAVGSAAQTNAGGPDLALGVGRLVLLGMVGVFGCAQPESIELAAIRGCGLEQEFSGLRVRVLGDFPPIAGTELLLGPGDRGTIPALPDEATGIAAEGLFGTTVTAIGRSFAIDPELARGRVPGHDPEASVVPVFFAAPDSACSLDSSIDPRTELGGAAGPAGDVLLVGGLDEDGALLDELVHVDLFGGSSRILAARLPSPRRGASVHAIAGRRFLIVGGASSGEVVAERIEVDVSGQGSVGSAATLELDGEALALAHHGFARAPIDGRALLVGGCDQADSTGACEPASARATSLWLDPRAPEAVEALPDLETPRFGAHAVVASDGVAYVAGGFGIDGLGLASVERLVPGGTWEEVHSLEDDATIAGLALIDGGLLVLADRDGLIHWWSEAGAGILDPTSRAPILEPVATERPLLTLAGERVLVDGWLFAPATAAVDPAAERVALDIEPRSGAALLGLADGTVVIAGGRPTADPNPGPDAIAEPLLVRVRPELDGPDEWIPDLAGPQTDAFVSNVPGGATVIVGGLRVDVEGGPVAAIAPIHAHVRGFRSRALRLEFGFDHDPGVAAQVVVGQGAATLVAIALVPGEVEVRRRDARGVVESLDCGLAGLDAGGAGEAGADVVLELGDDGRSLALLTGELELARCELDWPGEGGLSVGFGASGSGSARFFGLRLARR